MQLLVLALWDTAKLDKLVELQCTRRAQAYACSYVRIRIRTDAQLRVFRADGWV